MNVPPATEIIPAGTEEDFFSVVHETRLHRMEIATAIPTALLDRDIVWGKIIGLPFGLIKTGDAHHFL